MVPTEIRLSTEILPALLVDEPLRHIARSRVRAVAREF